MLPGDLELDRLHDVLQGAIGWTDSHLHRFRTGRDPRAPYFLTDWDLSEGEVGTFEGDVRLDEVLAEEGDALWYEYDFGDGWEHILVVEEVLQVPPDEVELLAGRRACPPEDVGGPWAYAEVARWFASGHDKDLLPEWFESVEHAIGWLPDGWRPEVFDLEATREAVSRLARRS